MPRRTSSQTKPVPPVNRLAGIVPQYLNSDAEHAAAIAAFLDQAGDTRYSTSDLQTIFPRLLYNPADRLARGDLCAYATKGVPVQAKNGRVKRPWEWHAPVAGRPQFGCGNTLDAGEAFDTFARLDAMENRLAELEKGLLAINKALTNGTF